MAPGNQRSIVEVAFAVTNPLIDLRRRAVREGFRSLNRVVMPAVKAGIGSPPWIGAGIVVLETTGRSSGLPRQIPLLAARFGSHISVSTVRSQSQWIKNLHADPEASVWVSGHKRSGTATLGTGPLTVAKLELEPRR